MKTICINKGDYGYRDLVEEPKKRKVGRPSRKSIEEQDNRFLVSPILYKWVIDVISK